MKLIDLLVQELPKRGGWPEGAKYCHLTQYDRHCLTIIFSHNQIGTGNNSITSKEEIVLPGIDYLGDTLYGCIVTAKEYESALAASQKPTWNGEGLPPVGCECEISFSGKSLGQCEVLFVGDSLIVWKQKSSQQEGSGYHRHMNIRPLRTEAERKREVAIEVMNSMWNINSKMHCESIYDAIAAGKIPGVKLEE